MAAPSSDRERLGLRVSLLVTFTAGLVAIVWGLLANSQIILFDGIYAFLGAATTGISMVAARISQRKPTVHFPFGMEAVVPLAVGLQGAALLGAILYAALEAVRVIMEGGSEVAAGAVASYGGFSALVATLTWLWMRRADPTSDLLTAEAHSWWASAILSFVILGGALGALALRLIGFHAIEPFIDPALVLVAAVVLLPTPLGMLRLMLREMLEGSPSRSVMAEVESAVTTAVAPFHLPAPSLRVNKLGRKLYVDADFLVEGDWDIAEEDEVRRAVRDGLANLPYNVWLSVVLTLDPALMDQ